jgi:predicted anti-sigma-YlaC factor YlaD
MKCIEATQRLSEAMDRELSLGEVIRLKGHLFMCDACTQYKQQLAVLRMAARRMGRGQIPGDGLPPGDKDAAQSDDPA